MTDTLLLIGGLLAIAGIALSLQDPHGGIDEDAAKDWRDHFPADAEITGKKDIHE